MNILKYHKFYFIGIKGVGMTMLAQYLSKLGKSIQGSDSADVFMTDQVLAKEGIKVFTSFSEKNIAQDACIIYSSAYSKENNLDLAFIAARQDLFKNSPLLSYGEALASIFNNQEGIAICGSHGKTSVSAMLAFVLEKLNFSPQALVGAYVPQLKGAALAGKSKYLLAELDEYQNKLQYFNPRAIVLNSIDYDHPDFFKTKTSYLQAFTEFIKKLTKSGFLVANLANKESRALLKYSKAKIYGYAIASKLNKEHKHLKLLAHSLRQDEKYQYFKVNDFGEFKIQVFGEYNVENALAVLSTGLALGIGLVEQRQALASFKGLSRRAELRGEYRGVKIYDDYGHHPNEIKAVLQSFKERFPKNKLVVVFQPHTFTRTKKFFTEFIDSLSLADKLYILEIYSSAREQKINLSSKDLLEVYKKKHSNKETKYFAKLDQAEQFLRAKLKKGDLLLLLGAGDGFRLADRLLD